MFLDMYLKRDSPHWRAVRLLCAIFIAVSGRTGSGQTAPATKVILSLSSPGSVANTGVETLSAQVYDASNTLVGRGLVTFYDGDRLVGKSQIITGGAGPIGVARFKSRFGIGTHSLTAAFSGIAGLDARGKSVPQSLTVTGLASGTLNLSATNGSGAKFFNLAATLSTTGVTTPPAGTVSFRDLTTSVQLGAADLSPLPASISYAAPASRSSSSSGAPATVAVADFDNDGILDVASGGTSNVQVNFRTADGKTKSNVLLNYTGGGDVVSGDFNSDGNEDVAIGNTTGGVAIVLGNGDGTFQAPALYGVNGHSLAKLIVSDFNGDGNSDVAVLEDTPGQVIVLLGNGDGTLHSLGATGTFDTYAPGGGIAADLNSDGIMDLVVTQYNPTGTSGYLLELLTGNGDGTFKAAVPIDAARSAAYTAAMAVGDVNADGAQDIIATDGTSKSVFIFLGNGNGTFRPALTAPLRDGFTDTQGIAIADLNADGKLDFAVTTRATNTLSVLLGDGLGNFALSPTAPGTYLGPSGIVAADLDGDSIPDLAVACYFDSSINYLFTTLTQSSRATLLNAPLPAIGQHNLQATFPGSAILPFLTSNTVTVLSSTAATTLTLTVPTTAISSQALSLVAQLSPAAQDGYTTEGEPVTFKSGSNTIGTATLHGGVATLVSSFPEGSYAISATYASDGNFSSAASNVATLNVTSVNLPIHTTLTLSTPVTVAVGTLETLAVQVRDSSNNLVPRGTVVFYDGSHVIGQSSILEAGTGPVGSAILKTRFAIGAHVLHAMYMGLGGNYLRSLSLNQTLTVTGTYPVNLVLTASSDGTSNALQATAQTTGFGYASGIVSFVDVTDGNKVLGTASLNPGPTHIGFHQSDTFPSEASLAQVDGDGFVDLVTHSGTFFGNGDGTFRSAGVPLGTYAGVVTDFNRDGLADFISVGAVSASHFNATGAVYEGDGSGAFHLATSTSFGQDPTPLLNNATAAGDLNNDGIPDGFAVSMFGSPLFLGSAAGTLLYSGSVSVYSAPVCSEPILRDLNGDGNLDVIVCTGYGPSVALGNGNGTTQPAKLINASVAGTTRVAVEDMNGDGIPDLVSASYTSSSSGLKGPFVAVSLGKGDGTFAAPWLSPAISNIVSSSIQTGDVNGDGIPDVMLNGHYILPGNGDGTLGAAVYFPTVLSPSNPAGGLQTLADVNGDGLADLVTDGTVNLSTSGATAIAVIANVAVPGDHQIIAVFSGSSFGGNPVSAAQSAPITLGQNAIVPSTGVDAGSGFSSSLHLHLNGSASLVGSALQLTDGGGYEAGSAWSSTPLRVASFTSNFHFRVTNAQADGFTFVIQNAEPTALGSAGGELGYNFIPNSVALKFDLYNNVGEGTNSVGVYTAGNTLTGPGFVLPSNVSMLTGHTMFAQVTYDGYTLTLVLTDTTTGASSTYTKVIDIPATINSSTAYVGFTGATGGLTSTIQIADWVYKDAIAPDTGVDAGSGFTSSLHLHLNGSAVLAGSALQLTDGGGYEAGSAWSASPVGVASFTSSFHFKVANPQADGFTFVIQNAEPTALGSAGGELGYNFIPKSIALKFDLYNNVGEGANSVGVYTAGSTLTGPGFVLPPNVSMLTGHSMFAQVTYNGYMMALVLTDTTTGASSTYTKVIDIPGAINSPTAYVGFTGATGGLTSTIQITDWVYQPHQI